MALGDDQVAREPAVALQLTATPAAAAPECVRLFSLTGGPRMPTRMLTRQEAGGQVRLLVAASASTRRRQEPDLCRQSPASEGQLPGAAANSLSRPTADVGGRRLSGAPPARLARHQPRPPGDGYVACICASTTCPSSPPPQQRPGLLRKRQGTHGKGVCPRGPARRRRSAARGDGARSRRVGKDGVGQRRWQPVRRRRH